MSSDLGTAPVAVAETNGGQLSSVINRIAEVFEFDRELCCQHFANTSMVLVIRRSKACR